MWGLHKAKLSGLHQRLLTPVFPQPVHNLRKKVLAMQTQFLDTSLEPTLPRPSSDRVRERCLLFTSNGALTNLATLLQLKKPEL